ncbi:hypothetical protein B0H11DRAFT_1943111 [Mycena galericulata]|nr:hypothetical protein B0H11DRAFT_1943111 [Mycena galericulata]
MSCGGDTVRMFPVGMGAMQGRVRAPYVRTIPAPAPEMSMRSQRERGADAFYGVRATQSGVRVPHVGATLPPAWPRRHPHGDMVRKPTANGYMRARCAPQDGTGVDAGLMCGFDDWAGRGVQGRRHSGEACGIEVRGGDTREGGKAFAHALRLFGEAFALALRPFTRWKVTSPTCRKRMHVHECAAANAARAVDFGGERAHDGWHSPPTGVPLREERSEQAASPA